MSKSENKKLNKYAEVFKALSNPNRLKIFWSLATCCNTACVGQIGKELDIVPSTVSHHIKELRRAGLIRTRRRGQNIECWVDPGILEELKTFFSF